MCLTLAPNFPSIMRLEPDRRLAAQVLLGGILSAKYSISRGRHDVGREKLRGVKNPSNLTERIHIPIKLLKPWLRSWLWFHILFDQSTNASSDRRCAVALAQACHCFSRRFDGIGVQTHNVLSGLSMSIVYLMYLPLPVHWLLEKA